MDCLVSVERYRCTEPRKYYGSPILKRYGRALVSCLPTDKAIRIECDSGKKLAMPLDGGVRIHHIEDEGKLTVVNKVFGLRLFLSGMDPEDVVRLRSTLTANRRRRKTSRKDPAREHCAARPVSTGDTLYSSSSAPPVSSRSSGAGLFQVSASNATSSSITSTATGNSRQRGARDTLALGPSPDSLARRAVPRDSARGTVVRRARGSGRSSTAAGGGARRARAGASTAAAVNSIDAGAVDFGFKVRSGAVRVIRETGAAGHQSSRAAGAVAQPSAGTGAAAGIVDGRGTKCDGWVETEEQARVTSAVKNGRSVLFTGAAGCGKSALLRRVVGMLPRGGTAVTASTGVAACNVGGYTLYAFMSVGAGAVEEGAEAAAALVMRKREAVERWRRTKTLVVDEVSMVDGRLFDFAEELARRVRGIDRPFGGMQLVLCGDFFQLPPVAKRGQSRGFAFEAKSWARCIQDVVELTKVFRQSDGEFIRALHEIRWGRVPPQVQGMLAARQGAPIVAAPGVRPIRLFTHRADVDGVNADQLAKLPGRAIEFRAVDMVARKGAAQLLDKACPAPRSLHLKPGAQVILRRNLDQEEGLVNGAQGVVVRFTGAAKLPVVRFSVPKGAKEVTVHRQTFDVAMDGRLAASRKQLPLALAFALSVHRSQGMTLHAVSMSLSSSFEYGQVYVALSRASSLTALSLEDSFNPSAVRAHPTVVRFYQDMARKTQGTKTEQASGNSIGASKKCDPLGSSGSISVPAAVKEVSRGSALAVSLSASSAAGDSEASGASKHRPKQVQQPAGRKQAPYSRAIGGKAKRRVALGSPSKPGAAGALPSTGAAPASGAGAAQSPPPSALRARKQLRPAGTTPDGCKGPAIRQSTPRRRLCFVEEDERKQHDGGSHGTEGLCAASTIQQQQPGPHPAAAASGSGERATTRVSLGGSGKGGGPGESNAQAAVAVPAEGSGQVRRVLTFGV